VGVHAIVREALNLVEPQADKGGVKVQNEMADVRRLYVLADRTRLKQILLNLLSNAIKYNGQGGSVRLSAQRMENSRLRISVTDTGPGIKPEDRAQVFTPFFRAREHESVEGSGIGLAITKRLLELMKGSIGFDSELGKGSTFWFELPLGEKPTVDLEEGEPSVIIKRASSREVTVLHVEDNPANQALVARILSRRPHVKLVTASSGEQGLDLARAQDPDLIVLDINLPGMTGVEVLQRLQADADLKHIPVVALTANAMPQDVKAGMEAGFFQYLTKPIDVKEFLRTVDLFISGSPPENPSSRPPPSANR
jgi:CheY-like chemotaxis protein